MHHFNPHTVPEALRWLGIAEKLLTTSDLIGSKTFATRAQESDPNLHLPDQILAIIDTLLAAETQISVSNLDWYAILQLARRTHDSELIASQYNRLGVLLNPNSNKFAYAEHAFKLVTEAWLVLSNPSRKFQFDNEIGSLSSSVNRNYNFMQTNENLEQRHTGTSRQYNFLHMPHSEPLQFLQPFGQQQQEVHWSNLTQELPNQAWLQPPFHWSQASQTTANAVPIFQPQARLQQHFAVPQMQEAWTQHPQGRERVENSVHFDLGRNRGGQENNVNVEELPNFWTVCPYCYTMHEYAGIYVDCTLRCLNCKKAFQAVKVDAPPETEEGGSGYYRCWGFFPIGISAEYLEERKKGASSWTPFTTMFGVPKGGNFGNPKNVRNSGPRIYIDDNEDISDGVSSEEESDEDWSNSRKNKKGRNLTRKVSTAKKVNQVQGHRAKKVQENNIGNSQNGGLAQEGLGASVSNAGAPSVPNAGVPSVPVGEANDKAAGVAGRKRSAVSTQQSNQVELERMLRGWI